jgi:S-DNA-T family DNA segregation ATPase FtsK/SpoIIIE
MKVLEDFGVYGEIIGTKLGPVVTLYEFEPTSGTKASRVIGLCDDIARSMSAVSARIAVIPGRTAIGIELPNPKREMIFLRELIDNKEYKYSQNSLPIILGKNIPTLY